MRRRRRKSRSNLFGGACLRGTGIAKLTYGLGKNWGVFLVVRLGRADGLVEFLGIDCIGEKDEFLCAWCGIFGRCAAFGVSCSGAFWVGILWIGNTHDTIMN